jgi:hypothetical protein
MRYAACDAQPGFEFGDEIPPAKIRWHGSEVEVKARIVPRYGWTTASIDVFLDGKCILRTGGQLKVTGSSGAVFDHEGSRHFVELSWGMVRGHEFPYVLRINDAKVALSDVPVENAGLSVIPALIVIVLVLIGTFAWTL